MITCEQTKDLHKGSEIHEDGCWSRPGSRAIHSWKWRVNGKVEYWKRSPWKFRIPVKYGLYSYGYVSESNAMFYHLAKDCPLGEQKEEADDKVSAQSILS